jgi:hypothetical protein
VCNAPASKTIFRMKMPSVADALSGKWPKDWVNSGGRNYEEMPIGRVFADAVLLPTGQVRTTLLQYQLRAVVCSTTASTQGWQTLRCCPWSRK